MECPQCFYAKSEITDSRRSQNRIRRRRKCLNCGNVWTTYEQTEEELRAVSQTNVIEAREAAKAIQAATETIIRQLVILGSVCPKQSGLEKEGAEL